MRLQPTQFFPICAKQVRTQASHGLAAFGSAAPLRSKQPGHMSALVRPLLWVGWSSLTEARVRSDTLQLSKLCPRHYTHWHCLINHSSEMPFHPFSPFETSSLIKSNLNITYTIKTSLNLLMDINLSFLCNPKAHSAFNLVLSHYPR